MIKPGKSRKIKKDFSFRQIEAFPNIENANHHGMIIVCLKQPSRQGIHQRVLQAFNQNPEEEWQGLAVVVRDKVQSIKKYAPPEK